MRRSKRIIPGLAVLILVCVALATGVWLGWSRFVFSNSLLAFSQKVRRTVDPEELRAWAMEMILTNGTNAQSRLAATSIPKSLRRLRTGDAFLSGLIDTPRSHGEPYVKIYWWNSFGGNKSILIGSTNFVIPEGDDCFVWVPGVYFINPSRH